MKIAVLGATGNTGFELVKQGLQRGHEVTAIVRNPARLEEFKSNPNFKIAKCANILKPEELEPHIQGQDCVLSALGSPGLHFFRITFYLDSIKSIAAAMRKVNVKRLLCVTAFYSKPDTIYPTVYKLFLRPMIGRQLDSMHEMEQYLINDCQDLDYTIVRPPRLLDQPLRDVKEAALADNYFFPDYSTLNQIPRANVARFMLEEMTSNQFLKKGVALDLPKDK